MSLRGDLPPLRLFSPGLGEREYEEGEGVSDPARFRLGVGVWRCWSGEGRCGVVIREGNGRVGENWWVESEGMELAMGTGRGFWSRYSRLITLVGFLSACVGSRRPPAPAPVSASDGPFSHLSIMRFAEPVPRVSEVGIDPSTAFPRTVGDACAGSSYRWAVRPGGAVEGTGTRFTLDGVTGAFPFLLPIRRGEVDRVRASGVGVGIGVGSGRRDEDEDEDEEA